MHVAGYRVEPVVLAAVLLAVVVGPTVVATTRARAVDAVFVGWLVVVAAVLLAPSRSAGVAPGCSFGIDGPAGWFTDDRRLLNIALFVPPGLLVAFVGRTRRARLVLALLVAAAPPVVEAIQTTATIGRACDATDVLDNWTGALLGAGLAAAIGLAGRRRS